MCKLSFENLTRTAAGFSFLSVHGLPYALAPITISYVPSYQCTCVMKMKGMGVPIATLLKS